MKEFMLRILNHESEWTPEIHQQFLKSCEKYIGELKKNGKLISAQPLERGAEAGETQVGYYHIIAKDMDEAVEMAKQNPEFEFGSTARIEVRPIKTKEKTTGFVYPKAK